MSMKPLTPRQREVLEFVLSFQQKVGRTPTGPEIAQHFGFKDHSSAYQHLELLAKKGYVEISQFGRRRPRGMRLSDEAQRMFSKSWPLLGSIPAGPLSEMIGDTTEQVHGLEDLIPNLQQHDYFLVVNGDSMIEAGLRPGQYVIVRPGVEPKQGDICAVWVEGKGGTLKHVYMEEGNIRLVPANPAYRPETYPAEEVRIQGVLVAALAIESFKR